MRNAARLALALALAATGCGTDGSSPPDDMPQPAGPSPIGRCLAAGGTIQPLWSANNQHGAITSIAAGGSTIVVGSEDGSVKQWAAGGANPAYGVPLLDDTGVIVRALAMAGDDQLVGVDAQGQIQHW